MFYYNLINFKINSNLFSWNILIYFLHICTKVVCTNSNNVLKLPAVGKHVSAAHILFKTLFGSLA